MGYEHRCEVCFRVHTPCCEACPCRSGEAIYDYRAHPPVYSVGAVEEQVRTRADLTTQDVADHFCVSVTVARWIVSHCPRLEFYDGNHIRFKETVNVESI